MREIKSYKDLTVWQKSIDFVEKIYRITACFPKEERYGLSAQMRRAAVSIPSNIAEGYARKGIKEYTNFVSISFASSAELETQLIISQKLLFIEHTLAEEMLYALREIQKMLFRLRETLSLKLIP